MLHPTSDSAAETRRGSQASTLQSEIVDVGSPNTDLLILPIASARLQTYHVGSSNYIGLNDLAASMSHGLRNGRKCGFDEMPKTSSITVYRSDDVWMDRNRVYKIILDDRVVGELWPDQHESFLVESGPHRVQVRIDFMRSNEQTVSAAEGQTVELDCKGQGSGMALIKTVFRPRAYLKLLVRSDG